MATSANLSLGAVPTHTTTDPFPATAGQVPSAAVRYATFDADQSLLYATSSPSQAKRALEAHLKDTDRRIQDASRLGTTLVQQRKELFARLQDVEQVQADDDVPEDLQRRLAELEREYNEIGKESARAFLPKSRISSDGGSSTVLTSNGRDSPTKLSVSSRKQRNQPSNRVHDIEFATEISTSLLAQVRQLQVALSEKDDALKETTAAKAHLEAEALGMAQKIRHLDDNEQKYKDENWNLEMKLQELEAGMKTTADKHNRLSQALMSTEGEKSAAQRDLDELKLSHDKLSEDHAMVKRQQENDLHGLRRDVVSHQTERQIMQKKIEELTTQNTELAKAVSSRWSYQSATSEAEFVSADEERDDDNYSPDHSESASPIKGTPRHGMLETETLKSSLNHAHRMIQNLKNNIHREKTEKIELKRMLQDARDELESGRRDGGITTNAAKKRENQKSKRPVKLGGLGVARSSTTEVLEDEPDWEDHEGERTPSRSNFIHESESSDAFETATERGLTTETEAFETGQEDAAVSDSDDLTETEGTMNRSSHRNRVASGISSRPGDRASFMSTASTSADEIEEIKTPVQNLQPKYRLRMGRVNSRRNGRVEDVMTESPPNGSPTSSLGTPQPPGQSLGDELDALDEGSLSGTPSRSMEEFLDSPRTPETQRHVSVEPEAASHGLEKSVEREDEVTSGRYHSGDGRGLLSPPRSARFDQATIRKQAPDAAIFAVEPTKPRPEMVSSGMMTEPWEPEKTEEKQSLGERAGEVVAGAVSGALAGFGLGRAGAKSASDDTRDAQTEDSAGRAAASPPTEQQPDSHSEVLLSDPKGVAQPNPEVPTVNPAEMGTSYHDTDGLPSARSAVAPTEGAPLSTSQVLPVAEEAGLTKHTPPQPVLQHSAIITQETQPIEHVQTPEEAQENHSTSHIVSAAAGAVAGTVSGAAVALGLSAPQDQESQPFTFSSVQSQHFEPLSFPSAPVTPVVPHRSSRRMDVPYVAGGARHEVDQDAEHAIIPGTDAAPPGAGFFAAKPSSLAQGREVHDDQLSAPLRNNETNEQPVVVGARPLADLHSNATQTEQPELQKDQLAFPAPLKIKKPMSDQSAQTAVSGDEVESMLRNKKRGTSVVDAGHSPIRPQRRSIDGPVIFSDSQPARSPRRPTSAGSIRGKTPLPPPLPENHMLQIAAAQKVPTTSGSSTVGTMGPPLMPASAYKTARPRTPAERVTERAMSRDGTTPRPPRARDNRAQLSSPGGVSRRTSVSSFASELDERFNITRGQVLYPHDVEPATDPRMIQAITQTMIGEYLWKYTRKAGRSESSNTRHRRFFWIHPYTRTLYWSEQDPSVAVPHMLKSKSLTIQAVRVITDDNPMPPGLHRKTLVVVTPGREIMMTAQTGQRHETWFNALSYLLLRTDQEKAEAEDTINEEDLEEFHPGFNVRQSINKFTGRDRSVGSHHRASLSSYNSRTSSAAPNQATLTQRHASASAKAPATLAGTSNAASGAAAAGAATAGSRTSSAPSDSNNAGNRAGRFSSITSAFRRGSNQSSTNRGRSRVSARGHSAGEHGEIYNASVAADSAEELRAVMARQESEAGQLENVRACCDGKHDVGSLSRTGRHSHGLEGHTHASMTSRFGSHSHR